MLFYNPERNPTVGAPVPYPYFPDGYLYTKLLQAHGLPLAKSQDMTSHHYGTNCIPFSAGQHKLPVQFDTAIQFELTNEVHKDEDDACIRLPTLPVSFIFYLSIPFR